MNRNEALKILGLGNGKPDKKKIKKAFKKKIFGVHPDVSKLDKEEACKKTIEVYDAYETLTNVPGSAKDIIIKDKSHFSKFWRYAYNDYSGMFCDCEVNRYTAILKDKTGMHVILEHRLGGPKDSFLVPQLEYQPERRKKWDMNSLLELFESIVVERGFVKEEHEYNTGEKWFIFEKNGVKTDYKKEGKYKISLNKGQGVLGSACVVETGKNIHNLRGWDHNEFENYTDQEYIYNEKELDNTWEDYWKIAENVMEGINYIVVNPFYISAGDPSVKQLIQIYGEPKVIRQDNYCNLLFEMDMGDSTEYVVASDRLWYSSYTRIRKFQKEITAKDAKQVIEDEMLKIRLKRESNLVPV